MEVRDIVQETGIKTIPMEKKCKKAKWLSGEALQIAVKRRKVKSKGEKERYKHLNVEFQRIAKRDKKAFLSDQCKEIEENNRMGVNEVQHRFDRRRLARAVASDKAHDAAFLHVEADAVQKEARVLLFQVLHLQDVHMPSLIVLIVHTQL